MKITDQQQAWEKFQNELGAWCDTTFNQSTDESILAHLRREVQELKESKKPEEVADVLILLMYYFHRKEVSVFKVVRQNQSTFRKSFESAMADSMFMNSVVVPTLCRKIIGTAEIFEQERNLVCAAHIVLYLQQFCDLIDLDLFKAVQEKFEILKSRQWSAPDHEGVVEHVRD